MTHLASVAANESDTERETSDMVREPEGSDRVTLVVDVPGGDAEDVQSAIDELETALRESDELTVARVATAPPPGAKGGGLVEALVTSAVSGVLPVTTTLLLNWFERRRRACTVLIDVGNGITARVGDLDSVEEVRSKLAALRDSGG